MAVNLTRIYTRTGDAGETRLGDMSKASKTDPRVAAYGDVDEANSAIGVAIAAGHLNSTLVLLLTRIQNDLFDVGADLCNPITPDPEYPPLRITQDYIDRLEGWCDEYNSRLTKLRSFILPGGRRRRGASERRPHGHPSRRAHRLDSGRGARPDGQPAGHHLPEPAVRPALHPGSRRQPVLRRRRPLGAGWRADS